MSISFWPSFQQLAGGSFGSPASIARDSQWTIVALDCTGGGGSDQYAELPSGAELGDLVEVFSTGGGLPQVSPPSGETFSVGSSPAAGNRFYRKIDASVWAVMD